MSKGERLLRESKPYECETCNWRCSTIDELINHCEKYGIPHSKLEELKEDRRKT